LGAHERAVLQSEVCGLVGFAKGYEDQDWTVERRNVRSRLAESVGGDIDERPTVEDPVTAAYDGLLRNRPGYADTRLPVGPLFIERCS